MAWTTPMTAVANTGLTAAQWNASIRDNLLETAPAKATTAGRWFIATGTNAIAERAIAAAEVNTQQTTTNTSYTNLTTVGPTVTVTTGAAALVSFSAQITNQTAGGTVWVSYAISGATTVAASDGYAIMAEPAGVDDAFRFGVTELHAVTAGSNTFQMKYRCGSGTGVFDERHLLVMAL